MISAFAVLGPEPLVTMLLGPFTWVWYLTLDVFMYVLLRVTFYRAETGIGIALLLYCGI